MPPAYLSGEQWNDSGGAPMSPWLKTSMNHHLRGQAEVSACVCVCFLYYIILISQSLWRWTSEHPASPVVRQRRQTTSVFVARSGLHCSLSLERPKWDMYTGTSDGREGKLVGWLETSVLRERSRPFDERNDWQWVFARLAGVGTQRWVSGEGQNGRRRARTRTTNKVAQTVSPSKLYRGQKGFWGDIRHAMFQRVKKRKPSCGWWESKERLKSRMLSTFRVLDEGLIYHNSDPTF